LRAGDIIIPFLLMVFVKLAGLYNRAQEKRGGGKHVSNSLPSYLLLAFSMTTEH